jgi:hypothetical protein
MCGESKNELTVFGFASYRGFGLSVTGVNTKMLVEVR